MTYSPPQSPTAAYKTVAKAALKTLRASDHPLGRPLALCLMFESAKNQALAASVFELAIALDAALHIPSETLLAAIRIQWWADELLVSDNQNITLVAQLQAQFKVRYELQKQIQDMIGEWQVACHEENRDSVAGWTAAWRLIAVHFGHIKAADQAAKIGHKLHHAIRRPEDIGLSAGGSNNIKSLRRNDRGDVRSWLYFATCLNQKLQRDLADNNLISVHDGLDDPALVWRILSWHFFGPPK